MNERNKVILLILIMSAVAMAVGTSAITILYNIAFEEQRERLVETAHSQARLIEAMARFDQTFVRNNLEVGAQDIISQIKNAHEQYVGLDQTGDFTLARREDDMIVFDLSHRRNDLGKPKPIAFGSILAEPMRRALSGQSGTMVGFDYQGVKVLAAHEPVAALNLGIVAQIDLAKVQAPFIRAGGFVAILSVIIIAFGTALFLRVTNPMIRLIQESEEKVSSLLDSTIEGIIGIDVNGNATFLNPASVKLLKYSDSGELLGKNLHKLIHHTRPDGSHYPAEECPIYLAFRSGETVHVDDEVFWRKDGTSFLVEYWSHPVTINGEAVGAVVSFIDITDRKQVAEELARHAVELNRSNAELKAANKDLEAFTYSVSHDLRKPIRAIDGFSKALIEDYGEKLNGEARTFLGYLRESSQEMKVLIDDLLRLSRATRGDLHRERTSLSQIAEQAASELKKSEPDRHVEFIIAPDMKVLADSRLMGVVIDNLFGNAWKFTGGKPQALIEFGIQKQNGETVYRVHDDGAGFDMAYADKLFQPFQRLHKTREFEGSGIGLSTVERIIARHGGRVWAESAVGEGATVYFSLGQ